MIQADEYTLRLSTGERADVSEFAFERIPLLASSLNLAIIHDVLRGCAIMSRNGVEAAKRGYDVELRKNVKEPIVGLFRLRKPGCVNIGTCVMADRRACTTLNSSVKRRIPPCWEYALTGEMQHVATAIVLAWIAGRRVIVVVPDPQPLRAALASGARRVV